ncbi:hypothetical protein ROZALSC1DRAFT_30166 [Rozella allomycis CSF55]|uniref:Uncharacterized protein n=1 Tax=Rozella allomycis (strain CSF55) TaxID=988480 RepID=A0A4V1IZH7_ROZAC|nr:hypothetical protein ROZALSC1DRAFT_30166 [Rozella allomycis CSF55]
MNFYNSQNANCTYPRIIPSFVQTMTALENVTLSTLSSINSSATLSSITSSSAYTEAPNQSQDSVFETVLIAGITSGAGFILVVAAGIFVVKRKRNKDQRKRLVDAMGQIANSRVKLTVGQSGSQLFSGRRITNDIGRNL